MAQERDPFLTGVLSDPVATLMLRSAPAFLSGMADVASVLHIMILCSLLPPATWVAGPALVLEIQGPDKSQIWPGLAWPGPQRPMALSQKPMAWSPRHLAWSWPLVNQNHAC